MKEKLLTFGRHVAQSFLACLTAMTQGDLTTLTMGHYITALRTGIGAGLIAVILSFGFAGKLQASRYGIAFTALIGTSIADIINHPTHFSAFYSEALVTGIGAGVLSLALSLSPIGKKIENLTATR